MSTIQKPTKGRQLSSRIYMLIFGIILIACLLIFWGMTKSESYSGHNNEKRIISMSENDSPFEDLNKIANSVPSANKQPQIITQNVGTHEPVNNQNPEGVKRISDDQKKIDYMERLKAELARAKLEQLEQGMKSSLGVGGFNTVNESQISNNAAGPGENGTSGIPEILGKTSTNTEYESLNMQGNKQNFLNTAGKDTNTYLNQTTTDQKYKYEVKAGSIIPAILETGINSDLPGTIIARIRRNVYDSKTGKYLLLPQGATLVGLYSSQVSYGQSRVLMAWSRVIFPDGQNLNLEGMPGADLSGYAGIEDKVNNHYFRVFSSAILMAVFTAGIEAASTHMSGTSKDTGFNAGELIAGALGLQLGEAGLAMVQKNLNIQPTLEIRPGCEFNILVTRDMPFRAPYRD